MLFFYLIFNTHLNLQCMSILQIYWTACIVHAVTAMDDFEVCVRIVSVILVLSLFPRSLYSDCLCLSIYIRNFYRLLLLIECHSSQLLPGHYFSSYARKILQKASVGWFATADGYSEEKSLTEEDYFTAQHEMSYSMSILRCHCSACISCWPWTNSNTETARLCCETL